MKITQEKTPFQPVKVVFDDKAELAQLIESLKCCATCGVDRGCHNSGDLVHLLAEKLATFVK